MTKTITIEPSWPAMRRWVLHVYRTDPARAIEIAEAMGCEAPELPEHPARYENGTLDLGEHGELTPADDRFGDSFNG